MRTLCVGLVSGLLSPCARGSATQQQASWVDVELPVGFHLELRSGEVKSRAGASTAETVQYDGHALIAQGGLLRCVGLDPTVEFERGAGVRATNLPVADLDQFLFDVDPSTWGYLRVAEVGESSLLLELAYGDPSAQRLRRDPVSIRAAAGSTGTHLTWPVAGGDPHYRVSWRCLGNGSESAPEPLSIRGGEWLDREDHGEQVVEYKVWRAGGAQSFGARVRAVRVEHPPEWPLEVKKGERINLLTGERGGAGAHVEVIYAKPPSVALRPRDGARLTSLPQRGFVNWLLPAARSGAYDDKVRTVPLGPTLAVHLSEGIYVRVSLSEGEGGGITLTRQLDLSGGRLLPMPPVEPEASWTPEGFVLRFPDLNPDVPRAQAVLLVVERELAYKSEEWVDEAESEPGAREVSLLRADRSDTEPLVRYRFRHRILGGIDSSPGPPYLVMNGDQSDPAQVERWLTAAFEGLVHPEFERRVAARGVLENLGEQAMPMLEEALRSHDAELAAAAREILLATASSGGGFVELLLRARAFATEVELPPPVGIFDADPSRRAFALLSSLDEIQRSGSDGAAFEAWRSVVSRADPEDSVAELARMLGDMPHGSPSVEDGVPLCLLRPEERPESPMENWRWIVIEEGPLTVARSIRRAVDASAADEAVELLALAHILESRYTPSSRWFELPGDAENTELILRLVQHYRRSGDELFLGAARALQPEPEPRLAARRELWAMRMAGASAPDRERIELVAADLGELEAQLAALTSDGSGYVDLVLPPGDYQQRPEAGENWIDIQVHGLRLLGGEGVRLPVGLRVTDAQDVVIEGIEVENPRGSALFLTSSRVLVRDCRLRGAQTTLLVDRSELDIVNSTCALLPGVGGAHWSVRLAGKASLSARACLFAAGSVYTGNGGRAYLDRCVVDGLDRPAVQGQRTDEVVLREVLLRSEVNGITGVGKGLGVGLVLDTGREPVAQGCGFLVCPRLHALSMRTPDLPDGAMLERCPLEPR